MQTNNFPAWRGELEYECVECDAKYPASSLLYSCPACNGVLLLQDTKFTELHKKTGEEWREIFDQRLMSKISALRGIFRFYELIAPIFDKDDIIYLGEAATPIVEAAPRFIDQIKIEFAYKNDGQNPSASFKDRGMACAFSYLKWLCKKKQLTEMLAICASTGDTSAAAALYAAYVGPPIKSVVILPKGKVTPEQLSQPLGNGATVIEIPGVFDDCMKVVENLAEHYSVALLNSKNSWRILGQESYAYEIAQWYNWNLDRFCIFVPIGNAGNITAIMSGFLKLFDLKIIPNLPRIFGVQSDHANPVFRYYNSPQNQRVWKPVKVQPSVAQAAMIGNPVSFPRVLKLAQKYIDIAGEKAFNVISVKEQEIIEAMLEANFHGHIACTQGGECLAGLKKALQLQLVSSSEHAVLDSTAHILKFASFQQKYFTNNFETAYEIQPKKNYSNKPVVLLEEDNYNQNKKEYIQLAADSIAKLLSLSSIKE